jgi:DNA-binding GntR family transcriptional regulator
LADRAAAAEDGARLRLARRHRSTTADAIYADLQRQIVTMVLKPGTALGEQMLASRFGVSRTPVREAIIRLGEERLVDVLPQQGTFVSRLDIAVIPEAVVIRQALEGATVRRAAVSATAADIARLDDILAEQRFHSKRGAVEKFMSADEAFHEAIADIAGLPGVWTYLKPAKVHIDRARWLTLPFLGRTAPLVVEHEGIRDAIARHDPATAVTAITRHLEAVIPDIAALRSEFPDFFV